MDALNAYKTSKSINKEHVHYTILIVLLKTFMENVLDVMMGIMWTHLHSVS